MRDRSPVETVLTYATFMALSLAVHVAVILGNRSLDLETTAEQTAQTTAQGIEQIK